MNTDKDRTQQLRDGVSISFDAGRSQSMRPSLQEFFTQSFQGDSRGIPSTAPIKLRLLSRRKAHCVHFVFERPAIPLRLAGLARLTEPPGAPSL